MSLSIQHSHHLTVQQGVANARSHEFAQQSHQIARPDEVQKVRPIDDVHLSSECTQLDQLRQSPELQSVGGHSNLNALLANYGPSTAGAVGDTRTVTGVDAKNSSEKLAQTDAATQNSGVAAARLIESQKIKVLDISNGSDAKGLEHRPPAPTSLNSVEYVDSENRDGSNDPHSKDPLRSTFTASAELLELNRAQNSAIPRHMSQV